MGKLIKFILILLVMSILASNVYSQKIEIKEFINDYANIIDSAKEQELNFISKQIYDSGVAEYSIVTINSLEGKDIESYSLDLAQGNLGDSETNNGLLLLVALEDRKYRFEVGRGIEHIFNDAKVGRIGRDYLVENFRDENYGMGIVEASYAVKSILLEDNESEYYISDEKFSKLDEGAIFEIVWFLFLMIILVILPLTATILRNRKFKNRYFNAAAGAVILFGGKGGHGGFGGGRGGFGGFGSGGFGGGGASGGW